MSFAYHLLPCKDVKYSMAKAVATLSSHVVAHVADVLASIQKITTESLGLLERVRIQHRLKADPRRGSRAVANIN